MENTFKYPINTSVLINTGLQHIPRARPNLHRQSIYGQSQEQHDRGHAQQPVYIHHIRLLTHSCTLPVTNNTQIVLPIVAVKIENQSFAITSK